MGIENKTEDKCNTCIYLLFTTLQQDEVGAGQPAIRCGKGHWEGLGFLPGSVKDHWENCKDYEQRKQ